MMNKSEVIKALRDERRELAGRIEAVDQALIAFGIQTTSTAMNGSRRTRTHSAMGLRESILEIFQGDTTKELKVQEIMRAARIMRDGQSTAYRTLELLVTDGMLERTKTRPAKWKLPTHARTAEGVTRA